MYTYSSFNFFRLSKESLVMFTMLFLFSFNSVKFDKFFQLSPLTEVMLLLFKLLKIDTNGNN